MESTMSMPKQFFISNGQILQRNGPNFRAGSPKTINYVHAIRVLSNNCDHQQMIQSLHDSYRQKLLEKDRQIQDLNKIIQMRDQQIIRKTEEIEKFQQKLREKTQSKPQVPVIQSNLEKSILVETSKLQISSILNHTQLSRNNQFQCQFSRHKEFEDDNQQILKIKKEMKSTQEALSSITSLLQKPKKKYQFFNSNLKQSKSQLQSPSLSRKADSNFKSPAFMSNKKQSNNFYMMDLSISKTDESRDNLDFIPQAVNQNPVVSSFLINQQPPGKHEITMTKQQDETKNTINPRDSQNDTKQSNTLNQSIVDQLLEDQDHNIDKQDVSHCKYEDQMQFLLNNEG